MEVFDVEIFDLAFVIPDDEEPSFAIYPFRTEILSFIALNWVSRVLTPEKYIFESVKLMFPLITSSKSTPDAHATSS